MAALRCEIYLRVLKTRGATPPQYLYGYVSPNGVVILKLLIWNGVSIFETFPRMGYNIWKVRKQVFKIIHRYFA